MSARPRESILEDEEEQFLPSPTTGDGFFEERVQLELRQHQTILRRPSSLPQGHLDHLSPVDLDNASFSGWLSPCSAKRLQPKTYWARVYLVPGTLSIQLALCRKQTSTDAQIKTVHYISVKTLSDDDRPDVVFKKQVEKIKKKQKKKGSNSSPSTSSSSLSSSSSSDSISRFRFFFWCKHQTLELAPQTDDEAEHWIDVFETCIRQTLSPEDIEEKRHSASLLRPIFRQQAELEAKRYYEIDKVAIQSGFGTIQPKKRFEGNLYLWDPETRWTLYHLALHSKFLLFFRIGERLPTKVLCLRFIIEVSPSQHSARHNRFRIITPLQTYSLKAKHQTAAENWVKMLNQVRSGIKPDPLALPPSDDPVYYGKKKLIWCDYDNKRKRSYRLSKGEILIGRSSSCHMQINDSHVSRTHAKIRNVKGQPLIIEDVGASHSIRINGNRVPYAILKNKDQILIGRTLITLEITPDPKDQHTHSIEPTLLLPPTQSSTPPKEYGDHVRLLADSDDESED